MISAVLKAPQNLRRTWLSFMNRSDTQTLIMDEQNENVANENGNSTASGLVEYKFEKFY